MGRRIQRMHGSAQGKLESRLGQYSPPEHWSLGPRGLLDGSCCFSHLHNYCKALGQGAEAGGRACLVRLCVTYGLGVAMALGLSLIHI